MMTSFTGKIPAPQSLTLPNFFPKKKNPLRKILEEKPAQI